MKSAFSEKCTHAHVHIDIIPGGTMNTLTPRNRNSSSILKSPPPVRMRKAFLSVWTTDHTEGETESLSGNGLGLDTLGKSCYSFESEFSSCVKCKS